MSHATEEWFNDDLFGPSPYETIKTISKMFTDDVRYFQHSLDLRRPLVDTLCEAMCVLFDRNMTGKGSFIELLNPFQFTFPPDWFDRHLEDSWIDFLESTMFTTEYWDTFWDHVGAREWEGDVFSWRSEIQSLLPYYVLRDAMFNVVEDSDDESDDYPST